MPKPPVPGRPRMLNWHRLRRMLVSGASSAGAACPGQWRRGKAEEGMMSARHRFAVATLAATVSLVLAGCGGGGGSPSSPAAGTQSQPAATSAATATEAPPVNIPVTQLFTGKGMPIGIYEKGFPGTTEAATSFTSATGVQPRMLSYYSGWGQGFATTFAEAAHASGAVPVVQLEPTDIPLGTIT